MTQNFCRRFSNKSIFCLSVLFAKNHCLPKDFKSRQVTNSVVTRDTTHTRFGVLVLCEASIFNFSKKFMITTYILHIVFVNLYVSVGADPDSIVWKLGSSSNSVGTCFHHLQSRRDFREVNLKPVKWKIWVILVSLFKTALIIWKIDVLANNLFNFF